MAHGTLHPQISNVASMYHFYYLASNPLYHPGQYVLLYGPSMLPSGEPSLLPIIAIVGQMKLWADQQYLSLVD
jgi:hypothetical protein